MTNLISIFLIFIIIFFFIKFKIIFFNEIQDLSRNHQMEQKAALHLAVKIRNLKIIKLLLKKKDIDINIEDNHGKKPIDYSENHEIKQLLSK